MKKTILSILTITLVISGFAQNVKEIEDYYRVLDENTLPVYRGHILNNEDLIIRKHILNLMCNFKTTWNKDYLYIEEFPQIIIKLKEMETDGLIIIKTNLTGIFHENG